MDWGFHAVIPRIIRTEYKELTPLQRWLYVCLKDLCGDHGTCYRTVRALVEETSISSGMISESIPVLHKAGLIHAEKKKRHTGGKEVWHITIIDIWQLNGKVHPTKRSPHEQECSRNEQTTHQQNVHNVNVHTVNENTGVCSPHEQECSLCETEAIPVSNTSNEAITESILPKCESASTVGAIAPSLSESSLLGNESLEEISTPTEKPPQEIPAPPTQEAPSEPEPPQQQTLMAPVQQQSAKVENAKKPRTKKPASQRLTLQGQHIFDLFQAARTRKVSQTDATIKASNGLGEIVESDDDFTEVHRLMKEDPFLKEKGITVDLDFMYRKWDRYIDKVDQLREAAKVEKAKQEAVERAKAQPPRPPVVKLTPLQQHLRDLEAKYAPKQTGGR